VRVGVDGVGVRVFRGGVVAAVGVAVVGVGAVDEPSTLLPKLARTISPASTPANRLSLCFPITGVLHIDTVSVARAVPQSAEALVASGATFVLTNSHPGAFSSGIGTGQSASRADTRIHSAKQAAANPGR
jgi:hypothetical protein